MKTLILLILISITSTSSQKQAEIQVSNGLTIETIKPGLTLERKETKKETGDVEMPNNWNVKVIEW